MINPTKQSARVEFDNLPGERRAFTIKATGKAFRTLVDGLYENKVGAVVREIMSNGYDSHVAAGIQDIAIEVTAPTDMDPTFRVRDFGVSMDHETIMDLYSQLFNSTKEDTNDQVGMFGLGSKSPFAYTDTFSVTAWLGDEKRVYVAHISDDDLPQITHIVTEPARGEDQGIEVAVPVKPVDVRAFHHEIARMVFAADVRPIVNGMIEKLPEPLLELDGVRVIRDTHSMGRVAIRQGCVIYPVHGHSVGAVQYGYTVIVDVPLGSVMVTASRESLSLDDKGKAIVDRCVDEANGAIRAWSDALEFENRLDEFKRNGQYEFLSYGVGRGKISLVPDKRQQVPAMSVKVMTSKTKYTDRVEFQRPDMLKVVVDRGHKIPRRQLRLSSFYEDNYGSMVAVVSPEDLPRLVRVLGLKPTQIISLDTIPDVVTRKSRTGQASPKKEGLKKGQFWVEKVGAASINFEFGGRTVTSTHRMVENTVDSVRNTSRWNTDMAPGLKDVFELVGLNADDVVFYTASQLKKLKVPQNRDLKSELDRRLAKWAKDNNLQQRLDGAREQKAYEEWDTYGRVSRLTCTALGLPESSWDQSVDQKFIAEVASECVQIALEKISPDFGALTPTEKVVAKALGMSGATPKLTTSDFESTVESAVEHLKPLAKMENPLRFLITSYLTDTNNQEESSK